ncbi:MAG: VWA domain-containing protein, partial [Bacteroidetes bacterium]|nr:VWA domain-containing protein [Bacteroidota bacterium]
GCYSPQGYKHASEMAPPPPAPKMIMEDLAPEPQAGEAEESNTEEYDKIDENPFLSSKENPLSTFSIDVDNASYSNVRRFINENRMPYPDAVRIEEMINYFSYDYKNPTGEDPFSINTEVGECPWNDEHYLVHIGLQGKKMANEDLPPSNLVFLLDVSGSMNDYNKLPLLKSAFNLLVNQLDKNDRVAIVVYAGAAGVVLPSTPASQQSTILEALNGLEAGGSTAGGAGIQLAYKIAQENFIRGGNNRVILATDGDFNVGPSSDGELVRMIEEKRENGVFLSVLGFGTGNYKDSKMEQLADKGNGNYAYIDNIQEAKKVLVNEMGGTLFTIAKDVKIQVEFNPSIIKGYRLIGYENRVMAAEDFNDDKKDAGELGAGHTVTALYEVVPHDADTEIRTSDKLKYQMSVPLNSSSSELMTVKFRYKAPDGDVSKLIEQPIMDGAYELDDTSEDYRFSAAVAAFGMILRKSKYRGTSDYRLVKKLATEGKGYDLNGYRSEFIELVQKAEKLDVNFGKED